MKNTLFILFAIVIGFTSCDKVDDLKTKDFYDIEVSKETTISVSSVKSSSLKMEESFPFSETINLAFADIKEIKDYLKEIEANLNTNNESKTKLGHFKRKIFEIYPSLND